MTEGSFRYYGYSLLRAPNFGPVVVCNSDNGMSSLHSEDCLGTEYITISG